MSRRRLIIPILLAGGITALAACGRDDSTELDVSEALYGLTVIDAVQLGASQGCAHLASDVTGSLTIRKLLESDGLVLLLEDGYPLCIDTMETVASELALVEASYLEDSPGEGTMTTGEVEQMMLTGDKVKGEDAGGDTETDPNPQPALEGEVEKGGGNANPSLGSSTTSTTTQATASPTSPSTTSPPDPPPETD